MTDHKNRWPVPPAVLTIPIFPVLSKYEPHPHRRPTMRHMPTREQLIIDPPHTAPPRTAPPRDGARPYPGLSDAARARQQESLRKLRSELIAEGAEPGHHLPELERRASTWPATPGRRPGTA